MFKEIKVNNLLSCKKVLLILLFAMFFIPKNVFAFTVTYDANGAKFDTDNTTNVVEYDNDGNIINGEYKLPNLGNPDDSLFYWSTDIDGNNEFILRKQNDNITVYGQVVYLRYNYEYKDSSYNFVTPFNGNFNIQLWGSKARISENIGLGAYTSGNIDLVRGRNLYIFVGNNTAIASARYTFNGGGNGEQPGGGATDVRLVDGDWDNPSGLASRIMVAGGGGGGTTQLHYVNGVVSQKGDAGGLQGYDTILLNSSTGNRILYSGYGGTQTSGGSGGQNTSYVLDDSLKNGSFGKGGIATYSFMSGRPGSSGGGGGYYGGGHGVHPGSTHTGGGGGSSYISGHNGCIAITSESDLTPKTDSIHYSGLYFTDTVMVDGAGYKWTDTKGDKTGMPNTAGTGTENGHNSLGFAKISYDDLKHSVTFKVNNLIDYKIWVYPNEKVTSQSEPSKIGYVFNWYKGNDVFDFNTPITEDIILNGVYSPITYNITYNVTGGTVSGNPDTYNIESETIILNNPTPNQSGYIFTGWTGTGLTEKTMTVTIPTGSIGDREYTAHFEKEKYTITYNLNGGELETGVANPEEYYIDSPDITLNNPSKEGYTFIGWTGSNGTTPTNVIIASGSTGNKAYTANYQIDRHTATFDSNLGTSAVPETITKDYNEALGTLPTTSRIGYIFEGWFTERDGGTQISSTTKMPAQEVRYYAHWTPITYTIHFNSNNGTGSMSDETMTYGVSKALTENAFTRDGWTFAGWNTKTDGSGTNYIDKQEIFNLTDADGEEFTLFAKWTKDEYIINYDADGGQLENPKTTYSVDDEEFTLVQPTKEGYTFTGWTGTGVTNPTKNVVIPTGSTGNRSYTAHWTATVYTIEYINNVTGETVLVAGNPTSYTVEDSDITLNNAGDYDTYHFYVGWTSDKDTESDLSDSYVIRTTQMKNLKIYAIYQTSPYTVSFDSDGGNNIDPISREGTEDVGPLPTPVKEGYIFKGWFVNNKLIDQTFHSRVDVTAIAKWEKIPDPVEPTIINPTTDDNIMRYIVLLLISIIGLGYTGYKFKLKTKKTQ